MKKATVNHTNKITKLISGAMGDTSGDLIVSKELVDNLRNDGGQLSNEIKSLLGKIGNNKTWGSKVDIIKGYILKYSPQIGEEKIVNKIGDFFKKIADHKDYAIGTSDIVLRCIELSLLYDIEFSIRFFSGLKDLEEAYSSYNAGGKDLINTVLTLHIQHTSFDMIRFASGVKDLLPTYSASQENKDFIERIILLNLQDENFDMIRFTSGIKEVLGVYHTLSTNDKKVIDHLIEMNLKKENYNGNVDLLSLTSSLENIIAGITGKDSPFRKLVISTYEEQITGVMNYVTIKNIDDMVDKVVNKQIALCHIFESMFHRDKEVASYCISFMEQYLLDGDDTFNLTKNEIALLQTVRMYNPEEILADSDGQKLMKLVDGEHISMALRFIMSKCHGVYLHGEYEGYHVEKSIGFFGSILEVRYQLNIPGKESQKGSNMIQQLVKQDMMKFDDLLTAYGFLGRISEKEFIRDMIKVAKGEYKHEDKDQFDIDEIPEYDPDILKSIQITEEIKDIIDNFVEAKNYYERVEWPTANPIYSIKTATTLDNKLYIFNSLCDMGGFINIDKCYRTLPRTLSGGVAELPHMDGTPISSEKFYKRFRDVTNGIPTLLKYHM